MSRNKKKEFQEKITVYLGSHFLLWTSSLSAV
jgi:hypothetical protein